MKKIRQKYRGKLIYVTPGSGKTTLTNQNKCFIDTDELMVEEIEKLHPDFPKLITESIQNYIKRFTATFKYKTKINNRVIKRCQQLLDDNLTILTGTIKLAKKADFVFVVSPQNQRLINRFESMDSVHEFHKEEVKFLKKEKVVFLIIDKNIEEILYF
jgi:hypothetical protein